MTVLSPSEAAAIAAGVYLLRTSTVAELQAMQEPLGCEGLFAASDASRFTGRSGAGPWRALTGFGYIANGEGRFAGDVLIATRGTVQTADWLSNLDIGVELGPGGCLVHAGFHKLWKSFRADVTAFLRGRNPSRIHCVGHSLGGALATLNADSLSSGRVAPVSLYTFGCPRVGDPFFARALTRRLGQDEIHRVAVSSDPVPMIPLFPFCHVPADGGACVVERSGLVSVDAHSMKGSYIPAVHGNTWASLQDPPQADAERKVGSWLERAAEGKGAVLMGSAAALSMIGRALRWLLARSRDVLLGGIGLALTAGATLLDQLAWMLARGASLSKQVGRHVVALMQTVFQYLGRKLQTQVDVTTSFLRWVLSLLFESVRSVAQRALLSLH